LFNKIIIIGVIGAILLGVILIFFMNNSTVQNEDIDLNIKADVIMPTKVSRPGCEENDQCYIPSQIIIPNGDQVTWINEDSAFHSVTSGFYNEPTGFFDSGYLDPYQSFSFIFDKIGVYDYYCTLHPWMKGQVIVE
jgi:plastocyanin